MPEFNELISSISYLLSWRGTYLFIFFLFCLFFIERLLENRKFDIGKIIIVFFLSTFFIILISQLFSSTKNTIFFNGDTFADRLKVIYSYEHVFSKEELKILNRAYSEINPYSEVLSESTGGQYNVHVLPVPSVFYHVTAYLIKFLNIKHPYFIFINFIFYLVLVFNNYKFCKSNFTVNIASFFLLISLASFPAIYMFQRGHFSSAYTVQFLITSFLYFLKYKQLKFKHFLFIAIALNFRPNYLFLLPIFINYKTIRYSLVELSKHLLMFISVGTISFLSVRSVYKNYTIENILLALDRYKEWHLRQGDGFESSLYRVFQQMFDPFNSYPYLIYNFFLVAALTIIILSFFKQIEYKMYFLLYSIFLWSPFADYHLLILTIPIIYHLVHEDSFEKNTTILLFYLLIILPKPHFLNSERLFIDSSYIPLSISNYFNASIFIYLIFNRKLMQKTKH